MISKSSVKKLTLNLPASVSAHDFQLVVQLSADSAQA